MKLFYRLADQPAAQSKQKLTNATKKQCLLNCMRVFDPEQITIFADRLSEQTADMVRELGLRTVVIDEGSGGGSFRRASEAAMELEAHTQIYLIEDDFLHLPAAPMAIKDGLALGAEYVTLYDHPDKYINSIDGGNPHVKDGGEETRLMCGKVCHWKITNSTVMTFATTAGQLRKDWKVFLKYCGGRYTDDYRLFKSLARRGRRLISAVPGIATHCEAQFLSPFTDWARVADGYAPNEPAEATKC